MVAVSEEEMGLRKMKKIRIVLLEDLAGFKKGEDIYCRMDLAGTLAGQNLAKIVPTSKTKENGNQ